MFHFIYLFSAWSYRNDRWGNLRGSWVFSNLCQMWVLPPSIKHDLRFNWHKQMGHEGATKNLELELIARGKLLRLVHKKRSMINHSLSRGLNKMTDVFHKIWFLDGYVFRYPLHTNLLSAIVIVPCWLFISKSKPVRRRFPTFAPSAD